MRLVRAVSSIAAACALLALGACSSAPEARFYTLGSDARTQPAAASPASFYVEVAPVDMPSQVAKNQLVVQTSAAQVRVLEDDRWASLPADEVRRALSSDLTRGLGTMDVYNAPRPKSAAVYRVKVNVQRFESWPGTRALIDAVWSVRTTGSDDAVLTCRAVYDMPVGAGYDALVAGHRQAVDKLAEVIGAGVKEVNAMPPPVPVRTSTAKGASAAKNAAVAAPPPALLRCPVSDVAGAEAGAGAGSASSAAGASSVAQ
jgi:uncharacterized protein